MDTTKEKTTIPQLTRRRQYHNSPNLMMSILRRIVRRGNQEVVTDWKVDDSPALPCSPGVFASNSSSLFKNSEAFNVPDSISDSVHSKDEAQNVKLIQGLVKFGCRNKYKPKPVYDVIKSLNTHKVPME